MSSNKELGSLTSGLAHEKFDVWPRPKYINIYALLIRNIENFNLSTNGKYYASIIGWILIEKYSCSVKLVRSRQPVITWFVECGFVETLGRQYTSKELCVQLCKPEWLKIILTFTGFPPAKKGKLHMWKIMYSLKTKSLCRITVLFSCFAVTLCCTHAKPDLRILSVELCIYITRL